MVSLSNQKQQRPLTLRQAQGERVREVSKQRGRAVALSAEWRTNGQFDTILIVDDDGTVREALTADPAILTNFLTDTGDLSTWRGGHLLDDDKRSPAAWGALIIARANTGEVIT